MINLHAVKWRIRTPLPNPTVILVLVPMFLIISSSVYPAIMSSIQNKEMLIIAEAVAQLKGKDNVDTSSHHATMPISSSHIVSPSSPTPIAPSSSATSSASTQSNEMPMIVKEDDIITPTAINVGDLAHVVWEDDATPGSEDIFYKRDGADFDPITINLSNDAGESNNPEIAVSGNNVYVVWAEGDSDIFYKRSTDRGGLFGPTINLSNTAGFSGTPAIAAIGNNVHVVWLDGTSGNLDILYKRSTDGGASFTEPVKNLSSNPGDSFEPAIAVSGNNVHVVWQDNTPGNFDILYRRSINGGSTFPNIITNLSDNAGFSTFPAIAAIGDIVHVVWGDNTPGNSDILYKRSTDGGASFVEPTKNLSSNAGSSAFPAVVVSGNNVHVVWGDNTPGNFDILYRRSINGGSTFPNIITNLSSNAGSSSGPAIAVSGNNVYVVWGDNTPGNFEIAYRPSTDDGVTFDPTVTNLSTNTGSSNSPAIAVTST